MTMLKKTVLSVLLSILLSILLVPTSFAHGDEDHGEKKVVAPTGQMNVRMAYSDAVEVLVKYSTPKAAEEMTLLIFLTDSKTNAPVVGATVSLAINHLGFSQPTNGNSSNLHAPTRPIEATASPTDTPGIYDVQVTFPEVAEYNLVLKLEGENGGAEVTIAGIVVPGAETAREATPGRKRQPLAITAVALFILAGAMSYLFWIRPRWTEAAAWKPFYTTSEETEQ